MLDFERKFLVKPTEASSGFLPEKWQNESAGVDTGGRLRKEQ